MSTTPIDLLLSKLTVKKHGNNKFECICPAHDDKTASLSVADVGDKIILKCFAGCATETIVSQIGLEMKDLFERKESGNGKPEAIFDYVDEDGKLIYQLVRKPGKKFVQRRPGLDGKWLWNLKGVKTTLYRLPEVIAAAKEGRNIFIVEGEKDVHSLEKLGFIATTNSGGAGKWKKHYSAYFKGVHVVNLPDNDPAGLQHAHEVAESLHGIVESVRILKLPKLRTKEDVSDWISGGGTREELIKLVKKCKEWSISDKPAPPPDKKESKRPEIDDTVFSDAPFRFLGYNHGLFFYLPTYAQQVIALTAEKHTESNLLSIASIQWWERKFIYEGRISWRLVRNGMFRISEKVGVYDSSNIRGLGAFYDEGRIVQHQGDHLLVDGKKTAIINMKTKYIYEAAIPLELADVNPISTEEASALMEICNMLAWEKTLSGMLLAGWCVIAPISGALYWRPHIWLTASMGTGKSWVLTNIIKPILGRACLNAQANTTEAGIRQRLGNDAFPVIIDEVEGSDNTARFRLQNVIELMRQASSEGSALIIKGTQSGHGMSFRIRSCFCLSSVNPVIQHSSDKSRITILSLTKIKDEDEDPREHYKRLKDLVFPTITPKWCSGFRARSISLIPVIRKNIDTATKIMAREFEDQRKGDQYAAMIAGAFSLYSDKIADERKMDEFIAKQNWTGEEVADAKEDEKRCLEHILDSLLVVSTDGRRPEVSVLELIGISTGRFTDDIVTEPEDAIVVLGRHGMTVKDDFFYVSSKHQGVGKILRNSPWEKEWSRVLNRIEGAGDVAQVRFRYSRGRGSAIPLKEVFIEEEKDTG